MQPLIVLGFVLLILLLFWAALNALQFLVSEIFQVRFFARITSEVTILLNKSRQQNLDRKPIINNFFETVTIQKIIPKFLAHTFSTFIQGFVGLILISFYHPLFFVFSIFICCALWAIWTNFYKKASSSSLTKSQIKYDIANSFSNNYEIEINQIDLLTKNYLEERKNRFRALFTQVFYYLV